MTDASGMDILRLMSRVLSITMKFLAILLLIVVLAVAAAGWRLTSSPITSSSFTPYIESVFERFVPNTTAKIGQSTLSWDEKKLTLTLSCEDVRLNNDVGATVLSFPSASLKMSVRSYLRGRILPQEFSADRAHFWLVRDEEGRLSFGSIKQEQAKPTAETSIDVISFLQNVADEVVHERLRHTIAIKDITLSIDDLKTKQKWDITVPEVTLNHNREETNAKASVLLSEKDRTSSLQLTYLFDHKVEQHQVAMTFKDIRLSSFVSFGPDLAPLSGAEFPASGRLTVKTDRDLDIVVANAHIEGGAGALTYPDLWDKPRTLQRFAFDASYDRKKEVLVVPVAEIDFGGPMLRLTAQVTTPTPIDALWASRKKAKHDFKVTVKIDNLPMDQYGAVWPKTVIPDARNWIVLNMSKGLFTHGEVTVAGHVRPDDFENVVLESGGGFIDAKGGRITYLEGMPAVDDASAHATFDLDHMEVKILEGHTGPIKLQPFTIVMDHFQEDVQYITIPAKIQGPTTNVLTLLDAPPLGYAKEIGLDPADSTGTVEGTLTLHMPLLDALLLKDVEVKAEAKLKDFGAKKLVPGIEISQGNLDLEVTKDGFGLKGGVALNKVPSQLVWQSSFHSDSGKPLHEGTVKAVVKNEQWDAFYGLGTLVKVQGETPVTISYKNLKKGISTVDGQVALKAAAVQVPDIAWKKEPGTAAQLSFALNIETGKNLVFKTIDLQGEGIKVKGTAELDEKTSQLVALNFNPFIVGRSNAAVHYSQPVNPALPLTIRVEGESFDTSGFEEDKEKPKPDERAKNYDLKVTKLYTSEKGYMASLKGHARRDKEGWREIDLWGVAQGSVPVDIKLEQKEGRGVFSFKSDNFGLALQGLGLSDGVQGGNIEINGNGSVEHPRTIEGKIKIDSFVVYDLPVLARLLSAVSPFGFVDLITGNANFDHLRGQFRWQGDQVDLRDVRAAGSVVGINLDGRIDTETNEANLNGTLVPFSFVNSIIGSIPLIGDMITGGSGQGVIAAAFTVKGPLANPDVSVNPVSLLTPGFLRNIFFAGDEPPEDKKP